MHVLEYVQNITVGLLPFHPASRRHLLAGHMSNARVLFRWQSRANNNKNKSTRCKIIVRHAVETSKRHYGIDVGKELPCPVQTRTRSHISGGNH